MSGKRQSFGNLAEAMGRLSSNWDKLALGPTPIDATARRVISPGEHYDGPATVANDPELQALEAEREDLIRQKATNLEVLTECKSQIRKAQAEVRAGGRYSSPQWWASVQTKAQHCGRTDQRLAVEIKAIKLRIEKRRHEFRTGGMSDPDVEQLLLVALDRIQAALDLLRGRERGEP